MAWGGTKTIIDNFDYAITLGTTPGMNGWTIKDTSSSGTPTYVGTSEDGGSVKLTCDNTNETQVVTLYQNNITNFDLAYLSNIWWVAKVADVSATTTLVMGVASAQHDTPDSVATNAWFRMEGSASTTALVVETDDGTNDNNDVATGTTLAAVYKRMLIDFSQGLADVRFFVDGARVASGTTFDMSDVAAGTNVQPFIQLQKTSTSVPAVQIAQFGATYRWSYGA